MFAPQDMPEDLYFKVTLPMGDYDHIAVANHNNDMVTGGVHALGMTCPEYVWMKRRWREIQSGLWPMLLCRPVEFEVGEPGPRALHGADESGSGQDENPREPSYHAGERQVLPVADQGRVPLLGR